MKKKWSILSGMLGNIFEWYDFILYAYFTPIFAALFFPSHHSVIALIATLGIFASGFLARPFGGALLGYIGDKSGRRVALLISLFLMNLSTLLIACLPTYSQIGLFAPLLLTLLRIMQGIAVGGELTGSTTFLMEHAPVKYRGLVGSLSLGTAFLGMVIGSAVTTAISSLVTQNEMLRWGWRLPYILGTLFGVISFYIRKTKSEETPHFLALKTTQDITHSVFEYKKEIFLLFMFTSVLAIGNYHLIAYITTYLLKFKNFNYQTAMLINLTSLSLLTVLIPVFGLLSDRVGRKFVVVLGFTSLSILALPIYWLLTKSSLVSVLASELLLSIALAPVNAVVPLLLVEQLPTQIRATGSSIAYNVSQAIFGGTAPLVSLFLLELTGWQTAPGFYLLFFALVALSLSVFLNKNSHLSVVECGPKTNAPNLIKIDMR